MSKLMVVCLWGLTFVFGHNLLERWQNPWVGHTGSFQRATVAPLDNSVPDLDVAGAAPSGEIVERTIFSPIRKLVVRPAEVAPIMEEMIADEHMYRMEEPIEPVEPRAPEVSVVGVIMAPGMKMALLKSSEYGTAEWIPLSSKFMNWSLMEVNEGNVLLEANGSKVMLPLYEQQDREGAN